jgi:3',5'-cyclic AMP phosphodiesterase CpdA
MRLFQVAVILSLLFAAAHCTPSPPKQRTSDATTKPVTARIALVSDPHVSSRPGEERFAAQFRQVIDEVNAARVDLVLLSGDLTQDGKPEQFEQFVRLRERFDAPTLAVAGNHDVGNKFTPGKKTSLGAARLDAYRQSIGPLYFAQDASPRLRIIGLCTPLFGSGLPEEAQQWSFLERELANPYDGTRLLLMHFPPFVTRADEPNQYFNIDLEPRRRLLALLEGGNVRTILAGHLHRPIEWRTPSLHLLGAPAVSFGLPQGVQPVGWLLVTVAADGTCVGELRYLPGNPTGATTRPATRPATTQLLRDRTAGN